MERSPWIRTTGELLATFFPHRRLQRFCIILALVRSDIHYSVDGVEDDLLEHDDEAAAKVS